MQGVGQVVGSSPLKSFAMMQDVLCSCITVATSKVQCCYLSILFLLAHVLTLDPNPRILSGCVPRLHLEQWLNQECRPMLMTLDGATLLSLLDKHSYGKTSKQVMYKPFLNALDAAIAAATGPSHGAYLQYSQQQHEAEQGSAGRQHKQQQQQQQQGDSDGEASALDLVVQVRWMLSFFFSSGGNR